MLDLYLHTSSKGPVAYAGDRSHSRVPFEIRDVFANTALPAAPSVSLGISLFLSPLPCPSSSRVFDVGATKFLSFYLTPAYLASMARLRSFVPRFIRHVPPFNARPFRVSIQNPLPALAIPSIVSISQVCKTFSAIPPGARGFLPFCSRQTMREI